jgi:hypothetical protein
MSKFSKLSLTCINQELYSLVDKLKVILNDKSSWLTEEKLVYPQDILSISLQKGLPLKTQIIVWKPLLNPETSIFFTNLIDGWNTLIHILSEKFEMEVFQIQYFDDKEDYMCSFFYKKGKKERVVRVMYDGKLTFFTKGEPLFCEKLDFYHKRRIKDRFNLSLLLEYMQCFGWNIDSEKFWQANNSGFYFEKN